MYLPPVFFNIKRRLCWRNATRRGWPECDRHTRRHQGNHLRKSTGTAWGWASRRRLFIAHITGLRRPRNGYRVCRGRRIEGSAWCCWTSRGWLLLLRVVDGRGCSWWRLLSSSSHIICRDRWSNTRYVSYRLGLFLSSANWLIETKKSKVPSTSSN